MIRLIQGGFHSDCDGMIKSEIKKLTEERKRSLLLVPEQQTVLSESEFTAFLPSYAPLCFEVTNFTRLANSVFRSLGGVGNNYCDSVRKALVMWRTLTELAPILNMTSGKREISSGLVDRALGAVAEMQSLAISSEELAGAESNIPKEEGRLSAKLSDLARIMALYKRLLCEKYADAGEDIEALCRKISENPDYFKETKFFISGFTSFTEPQYRLISELGKVTDLTVSLTLPKGHEDAFEYTEVKNTAMRISRLADKSATEKKLIKLGIRENAGSLALSKCCDLFWRTSADDRLTEELCDDELRIFEAFSPYEECEFVASDIRRRVALGDSYRDFAIIARNAEDYVGIIDTALEAAKLPHFISKKRDLSSFEAIKLIYTAYAAVASSFGREEVIAYAKCGLSSISREACDDFELYTHKWQISGKRFYDGNIWNMNPEGYTARQSENSGELLMRINEAKEALITPLFNLYEDSRTAGTVKEHAAALFAFLSEVGLEDKLAARAEELSQLGESTAADENARLWKIICQSLDVLVEVSENEICDTEGFLSQLKTVFASVEIGKIPAFCDEVVIGSADMLRLSGKKHVYLIGVNRGEFPKSLSERSYFTDRDKRTLSSIGISVEPNGEQDRARELYCFSRAFSYAKKSATLSYSLTNAQFSKSHPSEVIERIKTITDGRVIPIKITDIPKTALLYTPEQALNALGEIPDADYPEVRAALTECGCESTVRVAEERIENDRITLGKDAIELLYGRGELALTQSRIDSYTDCPLAFFCRYNLSLSEGEVAEFDARNIGSFIHAILESFFYSLRKENKSVDEVTEEQKLALIKKGARDYLALIGENTASPSRRTELLLARLCRSALPVIDGLCEEFSGCDYIPAYFELKIEKNKDDSPEPAKFVTGTGKEVFVYGSIDRVDTYKADGNVYVRVVDYKTGQKAFSPDDIEKGKNLQMFLYLKSVVETKNEKFKREIGVDDGGKLIPAGVIYVKTEVGDVKIEKDTDGADKEAVKSEQGRQGMLLNDPISISAMNSKYIPVKFKKDGTPDARSESRLYTEGGWQNLCDKMGEVIDRITNKMTSGDISAAPMLKKGGGGPCDYCKFKPICRNVRTTK